MIKMNLYIQRLSFILIILLFSLLLSGCFLDSLLPGSTIEIYGNLQDKDSLLPVANARIVAGGKTTYSNDKGQFHLEAPYTFDLNVVITATGYQTLEIPLFMPPRDGAIQLDRTLSPLSSTGRIEGFVNVSYKPFAGFFSDTPKLNTDEAPRWQQDLSSTFAEEPAEILVRFKPTMTSQALQAATEDLNLKSLGPIERTDIFRLACDQTKNLQDTLAKLRKEDFVEIAEPNYPMTSLTYFNDPFYSHQWSLFAINMEGAWQLSEGTKNVVVAVLDTGFLMNHPDLKDNIIPGYNFLDNNQDTMDTNTSFSHGTHVAGIIGALANNNQGIAGISPRISLMPLRVLNAQGKGSYGALIESLYFAADMGVDVINMSLGGPAPSTLLHEALIYAKNHGTTLIAATGNENSSLNYPAAYPEVIAVGSIGPNFERAAYSNYGPGIDLVAPGGDINVNNGLIVSTSGRYDPALKKEIHNYQGAQGTSMAAPHVSGIAALLVSQGINNPDLIREILINTATPINGSGFSNQYGWGLLNGAAALRGERDRPLVFAASRQGDRLIIKGKPTFAEPDGRFILEDVPEGSYQIYGWINSNNRESITSGDIFGMTSHTITIGPSENLYNINFALEMYISPQNLLLVE